MHLAIRAGTRARHFDLLDDLLRREGLGGIVDPARVQTWPHVAAIRILRQPVVEQHAKRLRRLRHRPVQLRRQVIEPALGQPQFRIRIQFIVLAEADDAGRAAVGTADTERADTEAHPALFAVDAGIQGFDQLVDVLAAPGRAVQLATGQQILLPGRLIGKRQFALGATIARVQRGRLGSRTGAGRVDRVRIKVIVDVHAIDIVAAHHVQYHVRRVLRGGGIARVHPQVAAVLLDGRRVGGRETVARQRRLGRRVTGPVRVEPGVQFQAARMRLRHPEGQRVIHGQWRLALLSGQVFRPRLQLRRVNRVGAGPHLQHNRVQIQGLGAVEDGDRLGLLLGDRQIAAAGPVDIGDRRDPGGAEFARRRRRHFARNVLHGRHGRQARVARRHCRGHFGAGTAAEQCGGGQRGQHASRGAQAFFQSRQQNNSLQW